MPKDNETTIQVADISGIRITCHCGAVHKGKISDFVGSMINACPKGHLWTVGDEENSSNITAAMRLISILNTMQLRKEQDNQPYTCALEI